jgi:hypothetical protein
MATLNIEGHKVTVDDAFLTMPEDQQHAAVDQIAQQLKIQPKAPGMAEGIGRAVARGVPIIGGLLNKADAATNAALAPALNPLFPEKEQLKGKTFGERYKQSLDIQEGKDTSFQAEHPIADAVAEAAGGIGATGVAAGTTLGAQALGLTGRTLPQMIARGAASGAAIDAADAATRGDNPLAAGAVGSLVGGLAPPVGRVANAMVGQPVAAMLRGISNPADEAARRVAGTINRDIQAGDRGLTLQEMQTAQTAGQPVMLMDAGGESTRALARSAANTSPEGRGELNRTIDARFESQSPRMAQWLRQSFHYPDATAQQEALDTVQRTVNRANYARAMRDGDRQIISPELERLMGSPAMVAAMQKASTSGKDRAITQGFGAFNTGVTVENGVVNFRRGRNGVPTYPNLAFWDATKRVLDDEASAAARAGRNAEASTIGDLARSLRGELDQHVPTYQAARAGAAHFFGAENALDAGQNFVGASQRFGIPATRRALAAMSPQERQLFQDGYVSRLVQTIEKTGDRRTIVNKIDGSPAAREELNVALGRPRAQEVLGRLHVENIMDLARSAVQGNSTTARQLVELGLAGGVGGYESYQGDPQALMHAALVYGAARGHRVIDERVAREVARLLVSNNVQQLNRGLRLLTRNQNLMGAIRNADAALASIAARGAAPTASRDVGAQ